MALVIPVRATSCTLCAGPHVFGCRLMSIGSRFVETEMFDRIIYVIILIAAVLSNANCDHLTAVLRYQFDCCQSHFMKKSLIVFQQVMFSCVALIMKSNNWKNTPFP